MPPAAHLTYRRPPRHAFFVHTLVVPWPLVSAAFNDWQSLAVQVAAVIKDVIEGGAFDPVGSSNTLHFRNFTR